MAETTEALTVDVALDNARRLLLNAEIERDHKRVKRIDGLAYSWVQIAALPSEREQRA